jgi:hypothetical protein
MSCRTILGCGLGVVFQQPVSETSASLLFEYCQAWIHLGRRGQYD